MLGSHVPEAVATLERAFVDRVQQGTAAPHDEVEPVDVGADTLALERSYTAFAPGNTTTAWYGGLRVLRKKEVCGDALIAISGRVADFFHAPLGRGIVHRLHFRVQVAVVEGVQQAAPGLEDGLADRFRLARVP